MNVAEPKLGVRDGIAPRLVEGAATHSRAWAISHQTIGGIAAWSDALIIFSLSVLSGVAYHLETIGQYGDVLQFGGFGVVVAVLFVGAARNRDLYTLQELLNLKAQS